MNEFVKRKNVVALLSIPEIDLLMNGNGKNQLVVARQRQKIFTRKPHFDTLFRINVIHYLKVSCETKRIHVDTFPCWLLLLLLPLLSLLLLCGDYTKINSIKCKKSLPSLLKPQHTYTLNTQRNDIVVVPLPKRRQKLILCLRQRR